MRVSRIVGPPLRHGDEYRPKLPQEPHCKHGKRSDERPKSFPPHDHCLHKPKNRAKVYGDDSRSRPTSNRCTKAPTSRSRPPIIIRLIDENLPICFAEPSFANETLNKNDIEHINTKRSLKSRCEMARLFRKKARRDRFDGSAPTYSQAAWPCFLASRVFEIMILRIETSINNIFLRLQGCPGVEAFPLWNR